MYIRRTRFAHTYRQTLAGCNWQTPYVQPFGVRFTLRVTDRRWIRWADFLLRGGKTKIWGSRSGSRGTGKGLSADHSRSSISQAGTLNRPHSVNSVGRSPGYPSLWWCCSTPGLRGFPPTNSGGGSISFLGWWAAWEARRAAKLKGSVF